MIQASSSANVVPLHQQLALLWSKTAAVCRAAPLLFKVQLVAVVAALLIATVVPNVLDHRGYQTYAFAIPAAEHGKQRWQTQVDAFGYKVSQAFGVRHATAKEFAPWILEASRRQGLDPELLASLVITESSFRKDALSHVGAVGPAQVRPELWSSFCGSSDLDDPAENIYCGAQVLAYLSDRCGDAVCGLRAYNLGLSNHRDKAGRRYVNKIDAYMNQLRTLPL